MRAPLRPLGPDRAVSSPVPPRRGPPAGSHASFDGTAAFFRGPCPIASRPCAMLQRAEVGGDPPGVAPPLCKLFRTLVDPIALIALSPYARFRRFLQQNIPIDILLEGASVLRPAVDRGRERLFVCAAPHVPDRDRHLGRRACSRGHAEFDSKMRAHRPRNVHAVHVSFGAGTSRLLNRRAPA